ncbi:helix-turn-helix domain-containing protein [Cohaesibacter celericrescens]|nr:AraC family transcriptional regulator [Cohaesibacter celericrescens]
MTVEDITPVHPADRPTVFREPGSMLYADNCKDLQAAAQRGEVELKAWTRGSYPGLSLQHRLPQICTVGYWDAKTEQDWRLARHCNEGIKLAYVARGSLHVDVDGVSHRLVQGQLLVVRPWQLHSIGEPNVGPSRLIWTILDVGVRRPNEQWTWPEWVLLSDHEKECLKKLVQLNEKPVWDAGSELSKIYESIAHIVRDRLPEQGETRLKIALNSLFSCLLERMEVQAPALNHNLSFMQNTVLIFLKQLEHALDQHWTLDAMAEECGLSRTRFADYCKKLKNMTPMEYLTHLRLEHGIALLASEQKLTVTEVAFQCGFNSSQYFSSAFRRRFGHPPSEMTRKQCEG